MLSRQHAGSKARHTSCWNSALNGPQHFQAKIENILLEHAFTAQRRFSCRWLLVCTVNVRTDYVLYKRVTELWKMLYCMFVVCQSLWHAMTTIGSVAISSVSRWSGDVTATSTATTTPTSRTARLPTPTGAPSCLRRRRELWGRRRCVPLISSAAWRRGSASTRRGTATAKTTASTPATRLIVSWHRSLNLLSK